ncbi:MAG: hypothetical protein ACJAWA_001783, partial [Nonlabens sp.]
GYANITCTPIFKYHNFISIITIKPLQFEVALL